MRVGIQVSDAAEGDGRDAPRTREGEGKNQAARKRETAMGGNLYYLSELVVFLSPHPEQDSFEQMYVLKRSSD